MQVGCECPGAESRTGGCKLLARIHEGTADWTAAVAVPLLARVHEGTVGTAAVTAPDVLRDG